jgi:hypothetical protein
MEAISFTTIINCWGRKVMKKGDFAPKPHCRCLGMTSKVRTAGKRPLGEKEAQPQTALEKFCTNPDGVMVFCKR